MNPVECVHPSEHAVIATVIFATPVGQWEALPGVLEDQLLVLDLTLTSLDEIVSLLKMTG